MKQNFLCLRLFLTVLFLFLALQVESADDSKTGQKEKKPLPVFTPEDDAKFLTFYEIFDLLDEDF